LIQRLQDDDHYVRWAAAAALGQLGDQAAVAPLIQRLQDPDSLTRINVAVALMQLGEELGPVTLNGFLNDSDTNIRQTAVGAYSRTRDHVDQLLLSRDIDAMDPWIDSHEPINEARLQEVASRLSINIDDVRKRYEVLSVKLRLKLSWIDI
jgi:HEAT repeat protein